MEKVEQAKKQVDKQNAYYKKLKHDYETVFSTGEGKRVLEDIKRCGFVFKTSMIQGDSHATAFNEGRRELALHIDYMSIPRATIENAPKEAIT
ncbi:MAG: hypothetical protein U9O94_04885 [Nanoarchaeota archaeon]|nr:hypothetical protein [Nanoarchaeota archaeon]